MLRALILDYGEVLSLPQPSDALPGMAAAAQAAAQPFAEAYWRYRGDYDRGMPASEYWQNVLADAHAARREPADIDHLIALDVRSWTAYREEVWALAAEQRGLGVRTAVLSNGVPEIMDVIERDRAISRKFDTVVVSYEVGCAKPDAQIFELTLERLGVAAPDALFVDDREVNLDGARRVGLRTLHFTGPHAVESLKAALGPRR
jgi:putative hydrolase of the HAD superfamily